MEPKKTQFSISIDSKLAKWLKHYAVDNTKTISITIEEQIKKFKMREEAKEENNDKSKNDNK